VESSLKPLKSRSLYKTTPIAVPKATERNVKEDSSSSLASTRYLEASPLVMIGSPFTQSGLSFVSPSPKDDLPKSRLDSFLPLGASTVLLFFHRMRAQTAAIEAVGVTLPGIKVSTTKQVTARQRGDGFDTVRWVDFVLRAD
jgi:hypothetical protein